MTILEQQLYKLEQKPNQSVTVERRLLDIAASFAHPHKSTVIETEADVDAVIVGWRVPALVE